MCADGKAQATRLPYRAHELLEDALFLADGDAGTAIGKFDGHV